MYNILVCDDDRDIRNALRIYLNGEGYGVLEASNGKEALDKLASDDIHIVLMDIMMPLMDGMTATARIRQESNVPVILLTAKGEDMDKVAGLTVGKGAASSLCISRRHKAAASQVLARRRYRAGRRCEAGDALRRAGFFYPYGI